MDESKNPAIEELGRRLFAAERQQPQGWRPSRVQVAAGSAALLALFALTPPGHVVADGIGDLVGIGEESSVEHGGNEADSVVIREGTAPNGTPYEIAAYTHFGFSPDQSEGALPGSIEVDREKLSDELCLSLDVASEKKLKETGGVCFTSDSFDRYIEREVISPHLRFAPDEFQPETELMVVGHAGSEVSDVEVTYKGESGSREDAIVEFARVSSEQAETIASPRGGAAFFAFLPMNVLRDNPRQRGVLTPEELARAGGTIQVTALNEAGEVIQEKRVPIDPFELPSLEDAPERFSNTPTLREVMKECVRNLKDCEIEPAGDTTPPPAPPARKEE